jgi:hypothetical protein
MQCEYRIFELNRRISNRSEYESNDNYWWDSLVNEFFDDDAQFTIKLFEDNNLKPFSMCLKCYLKLIYICSKAFFLFKPLVVF